MTIHALSHFSIPPLFFPPPKEDTSDFRRRGLFPNLSDKILPLLIPQIVLQHATHGNRTGLPDLVTHGEKPAVVFEHVADFDGVFQNLGDGVPQPVLHHRFLTPPRLVLRIDHANINHGLVVESATLPPQFGPLRLLKVAGAEVLRLNHQQRMEMRMRVPSPPPRDLDRAHPADSRKDLQLRETLPPLTHHFKCEAQQVDIAVLNGEGGEEKSCLGIVSHQPRQCPVDTCLPHQRPAPLADRTESDAAKARVLQLELCLTVLGRIAGEANVLTTLTYPFRVAMMTRERTRREDSRDIVSFSPVLVPRFVLRRNVRQILLSSVRRIVSGVDWNTASDYITRSGSSIPHIKPPVIVVSLVTSTVPGVSRFYNPLVRSKSASNIHNMIFIIFPMGPSCPIFQGPSRRSYPSILKVPPVSWGLTIAPNSDDKVQAKWYDSTGKKQYGYHPQWVANQSEKKFAAIQQMKDVLPEIEKRIAQDLQRDPTDPRAATAAVVQLIHKAYIRVGSEEYAQAHETYGASSLRKHHVELHDDGVSLKFIGKHGKEQSKRVVAPEILPVLKHLMTVPGERLFQFAGKEGPDPLTEQHVRAYLSPHGITPKSFRTYHATRLAGEALEKLGPPASEQEAKKNIAQVVKEVSGHLGNTPVVCRANYINPAVLDTYAKKYL